MTLDITPAESLAADREALLSSARDFARREIAPHVADYDREERFPLEIVRKAGDLGLDRRGRPRRVRRPGPRLAVVRAADRGDLARLPHRRPGDVVPERAGRRRHPAATAPRSRSSATCPLCARARRSRAPASPSPAAGTDVAEHADALPARRRRVRDQRRQDVDQPDRPLRLDPHLRDARPGAAAATAICAFIVHADTPGLTRRARSRTSSASGRWRRGDLFLDDVRVPVENTVGEEGQGYEVAMSAVETGRLRSPRRARRARPGLPGRVGRLRARADRVRPGDRPLPARAVDDHRHGRRHRGRSRRILYDLARCDDAGRARRAATRAGQDARDRRRDDGGHARGADPRRLRRVTRTTTSARHFRDAKVFQIVEGKNQLHRGMVAEYALGYREPDR